MTGNWGIILVISLGAAIASVIAMHLKSRLHGEQDRNPPVVRHVAAYFLAYVAGFAAAEAFERPWSLLLMAALGALAFAVTIHGPKPLATTEYARTAAATFGVFLAIWLLYQLLLLVGIDLLAADFIRRP